MEQNTKCRNREAWQSCREKRTQLKKKKTGQKIVVIHMGKVPTYYALLKNQL